MVVDLENILRIINTILPSQIQHTSRVREIPQDFTSKLNEVKLMNE